MESSWNDTRAFGLPKLKTHSLHSSFALYCVPCRGKTCKCLKLEQRLIWPIKNFYQFVNCHCKHQVTLLRTIFIQKVWKYWYLVSHILLNLFVLQASHFPVSLQQPLGVTNLLRQFGKLLSSCEIHPFSPDTLTGHVKQLVLSQRKGKHFCLNHLQLFKATLLWFALEEPRHAYDFPYEESSNSWLRLLSAQICIFHMILLLGRRMLILPRL